MDNIKFCDLSADVQQEIIDDFKRDKNAFEDIYSHYYEIIFRFLLKRTMSAEVAYDLTSDTFMNAFESFHKFKWKGYSIKVWLFRIAINSLKNYRRGKKPISALEDVGESHENMRIEVMQELTELDRVLFGDDQIGRLSDAIETLNPKYQNVISLYYFSEMSQAEIADTIKKSVGAVKSLLHRATLNLRKLLEPNFI